MEGATASGYVLALGLLVGVYVRHSEDDALAAQQREGSLLSPDLALERKTIARDSQTALASLLLRELQRPRDVLGDADAQTSLHALFQRLSLALRDRPQDATLLTDEVLATLAGIDSPDALGDVVDAIAECVAPLTSADDAPGDATSVAFTRTSVFGVFVRRLALMVNRGLFDSLSQAFDDVSRYYEEYVEQQTRLQRGGVGTSTVVDDLSLSLTSSPSSRFLWKQGDDMDDLPLSPIVGASSSRGNAEASQFSSLSLQGNGDDHTEDGGGLKLASNKLSHEQTQYYLHDLTRELNQGLSVSLANSYPQHLLLPLRKIPDPDALFVEYLHAVNRREYEAAVEALHMYHDAVLSRTRHFQKFLNASNADTRVEGSNEPVNQPTRHVARGNGVQYASLNMAALHVEFDEFPAAEDSIKEAIRLAQGYGDHVCVAFALSWFIRIQLVQGKPRHEVAELITSAIERAEDVSIQSLRVLSSLTSLEFDAFLGRSDSSSTVASGAGLVARFPAPRPLDLWSRFNDVDQILFDLSASAASATGTGNAGRSLGIMMGMQMQLQQGGAAASSGSNKNGMTWLQSINGILSTVWSLQGKSRVAAAVSWQLLGARALSDVFDNVFWTSYKSSLSSAEIASWISRMVFSRVEWSADVDDEASPNDNEAASQIQFVGAFRLMIDILRQPDLQRHQLLVRDKLLQRTIHHVLALWCLHRGELAFANAYISQLITFSSASSDFPARVEALILQSRLWGEMGDYLRCFDELDNLDAMCRRIGYDYLLVQVLILRSDYVRRSRLPHSPFDALPYVLEAIHICKANRYDLLLAEAHLVISEIHIAMGKLGDAVELLDQQMPLVMEHGSIQLRAESMLILAKATLAKANSRGQSPPSPSTDAVVLVDGRVIEWLDDSAALYSRLEDWKKLREIAYLKTVILHSTEDSGATEAAKQFRHYEQLLQLAQNKQSVGNPITSVDSVGGLARILQERQIIAD